MIRILLHPNFLDYLKTTRLLESSAGALFKEATADGDERQRIWLSEEDLCMMWKVVLKSKISRQPNGHRLENFTWRLWHFAQARRRKNSCLDSDEQQSWEDMSVDQCNLSNKGYEVPSMPSLLRANRGSLNASWEQSSKSFAPTHEFSLMSLDGSYARTGTNSSMSTLTSVEEYLSSTTNEDSRQSEASIQERTIHKLSKKKKKNVDRYLKKHRNMLGHDNLEKIVEQKEESRRSSITSAAPMLISPPQTISGPKSTPDVDKIAQIPTKSGITARKVSRGFCIPTRKTSSNGSVSNSEKSSHRSATHLSSISYEDSFGKKSNSLNQDSAIPTYRIRKQSFSRSVSPNTNRPAASMLTILMNGQLTTTSPFSPTNSSRSNIPPRPSAPVQSPTTSFMMANISDRPYLDDDAAFDSNSSSSVNPETGTKRKSTPRKSAHILDHGIKPSVHIW